MLVTYRYTLEEVKKLITKDWEEKVGIESQQGLAPTDIRVCFDNKYAEANPKITFEFEVFE